MTAAITAARLARTGWLDELRCVGELAAITGAVDAAVAVEAGGDLRIVGSVVGTFAERTIGPQLCPELFATSLLAEERWLSGASLAHLYLPPHAEVLVLPVRSQGGWNGAALLRYDGMPALSRHDLAVLRSALRRHAAGTAAEAPIAA